MPPLNYSWCTSYSERNGSSVRVVAWADHLELSAVECLGVARFGDGLLPYMPATETEANLVANTIARSPYLPLDARGYRGATGAAEHEPTGALTAVRALLNSLPSPLCFVGDSVSFNLGNMVRIAAARVGAHKNAVVTLRTTFSAISCALPGRRCHQMCQRACRLNREWRSRIDKCGTVVLEPAAVHHASFSGNKGLDLFSADVDELVRHLDDWANHSAPGAERVAMIRSPLAQHFRGTGAFSAESLASAELPSTKRLAALRTPTTLHDRTCACPPMDALTATSNVLHNMTLLIRDRTRALSTRVRVADSYALTATSALAAAAHVGCFGRTGMSPWGCRAGLRSAQFDALRRERLHPPSAADAAYVSADVDNGCDCTHYGFSPDLFGQLAWALLNASAGAGGA
jgi:hypothetical protein